MPHTFSLRRGSLAALSALLLTAALAGCVADGGKGKVTTSTSQSQQDSMRPALVVTSEPPPEVIYRAGSRDTTLAEGEAAELAPVAEAARKPLLSMGRHDTLVARKVADLTRDLSAAHDALGDFRTRLSALQAKCDAEAGDYYAAVAEISTELQSGTTAGNPVLTERWNAAQGKLEALSETAGGLNALSADLAAEAAKAAYLQESVRATYGLSGAMKEDRKALQALEDDVNQSIAALSRLLTAAGDETNRRTATLRAENLNMQTLSLAIANGELYGQNMTNSLFKKASADAAAFVKGGDAAGVAAPAQRRPLVVIRFNRPNVDYRQAVYTAVSQALDKYPAAKFDLVAVSPSEGNPAAVALASTEARKNGEAVLRSLTQMGLPMERISLGAANSRNVANSEVHLFVQ